LQTYGGAALDAALQTRQNYSAKLPCIPKAKQVLSFDQCKLFIDETLANFIKQNRQQ
jgi:hypothetical protein